MLLKQGMLSVSHLFTALQSEFVRPPTATMSAALTFLTGASLTISPSSISMQATCGSPKELPHGRNAYSTAHEVFSSMGLEFEFSLT